MSGLNVAYEAVPLAEFIPPYLSHVAAQGNGLVINGFGISSEVRDSERDLLITSMNLARGFEYAMLADSTDGVVDREVNGIAEAIISQTCEDALQPFITNHRGFYLPSVSRTALTLRLVSDLVKNRHDAEALEQSYLELHLNAAEDIQIYRRLFKRHSGRNRAANIYEGDGYAGELVGAYAESVIKALLTRARPRSRNNGDGTFSIVHGSFVVPALPSHDRSFNISGNHDMVFIAKNYYFQDEDVRDPDNVYSPFSVQRVQIKRGCLGYCALFSELDSKQKDKIIYRRDRTRQALHAGIVLCSAHCDLGGEDDSLDQAADLVVRSSAGILSDKDDKMRLHQVTRQLEGAILNPYPVRRGLLKQSARASTNGHRVNGKKVIVSRV